jgi:FkbM family methyltransferase
MVKLDRIAEKLFDLLVIGISKKNRIDFTLQVHFDACKLLIRPFIFSEIIMVSGRWEPYVKNILERKVKESDVIVDVGANIGIYAVPLAKRVKKVIAFEPHPKTSEILEKNVKLNNINNLILIRKAVGNSSGNVRYSLSKVPQESGIFRSNNNKIETIIEMECVDLDHALLTESKVDWLLIDVERFEFDVLKGALNILYKCQPRIIYESHEEESRKVKEMLENEGYLVTQVYSIYYFAEKKREQ